MTIHPTPLTGAFVIEPQRVADARGFFARTFCRRTFAGAGLVDRFEQCSISYTARRGTLRGLHYQADPHGETKLIRCTAGAVWDVWADLRPHSPTYRKWHAVELSADNRLLAYVPPGLAHGFITLTDAAELFYQIDAAYVAEAARGVRWDDPTLAIDWPLEPAVLSDRDAAWPGLQP